MNEPITPADLSRELGRNQRTIRAYLRQRYGKLQPPNTRWELNNAQAADVRAHFQSRAR